MSETHREYGELYYHSSAISALLGVVAELLEADKRRSVHALSHSIPTTMPWPYLSTSVQSAADDRSVFKSLQLRIFNTALFGDRALRLAAIIRNGPSPQCPVDWEYTAGLANEQPNDEGAL
jgi:hypothetical protein